MVKIWLIFIFVKQEAHLSQSEPIKKIPLWVIFLLDQDEMKTLLIQHIRFGSSWTIRGGTNQNAYISFKFQFIPNQNVESKINFYFNWKEQFWIYSGWAVEYSYVRTPQKKAFGTYIFLLFGFKGKLLKSAMLTTIDKWGKQWNHKSNIQV